MTKTIHSCTQDSCCMRCVSFFQLFGKRARARRQSLCTDSNKCCKKQNKKICQLKQILQHIHPSIAEHKTVIRCNGSLFRSVCLCTILLSKRLKQKQRNKGKKTNKHKLYSLTLNFSISIFHRRNAVCLWLWLGSLTTTIATCWLLPTIYFIVPVMCRTRLLPWPLHCNPLLPKWFFFLSICFFSSLPNDFHSPILREIKRKTHTHRNYYLIYFCAFSRSKLLSRFVMYVWFCERDRRRPVQIHVISFSFTHCVLTV